MTRDEDIRASDIVRFEPEPWHRRAAAPDRVTAHIVITGTTGGKTVAGMEKMADVRYAGKARR